MPHVTLIYPFIPHHDFGQETLGGLTQACLGVEPFEVTLARFKDFRHGKENHTIWLAPEPGDELDLLQGQLAEAFPEYDDVRSFPAGFTPHLSVGQIKGDDVCAQFLQSLQVSWSPITFVADRISLIWRNEPPDDVFRVYKETMLGSGDVVDPEGQ
jgi:RNA 2',3'-cyclic 3'-phosphodiesterase